MTKPRHQPYKSLSLDQLRNFCEVMRHRSYAETSRKIGLSTATLWEQVRAVERHFGVVLLERRGRRIEATEKARRLLEWVLPTLANLDSMREALQQEGETLPAKITVVAAPRMLMEELVGALSRFRKLFPTIPLELIDAGTEEPQALIASGAADLALMVEPAPAERRVPGIEYETAYEIAYLLVMPARHPLARKKNLVLADIVKYPLVLRRANSSARRRVEDVFQQHDLAHRLQVSVETSSSAFSLAFVRGGLGIALIAGNPHGMLSRGLCVRPVDKWFGSVRICFVRKKGAFRSPVLDKLEELIRSAIRVLTRTAGA
jgi:DNA-binding transcriptional LysR family regulator